MKIGNLNYPMIFSHALHNKIPVGTRTVIAKGKFDGAYVNIQVGLHKQKELLKEGKISKSNALIFNQDLPSDKSNYHLSTLNHHHIVEAFDRFLKNSKFEARIQSLREKHSLDKF